MPTDPRDVLIVDDSRRSQIYFEAFLRRIPGLAVHHAETAAEAVAKLRAGLRPAVILLDLEMPNGPGESLLPTIRELCPGALTAIFSGVPDEARLASARAAAPEPVLVLRKPVDLDELLAAIRGESPAS